MRFRDLILLFGLMVMVLPACDVSPTSEPSLKATATTQPFFASTLTQPSPYEAGQESSGFQRGLIPQEQTVIERFKDASQYQIELEILPDFSAITGSQNVTYTNQEESPLSEIYFHLFPNILGGGIEVTTVRVNGQKAEAAYEFGGSALRLSLPAALQPGDKVVIDMDFSVSIPRQMGGSYGLLSFSDGVLALDSIYPSIAVYDEGGWRKEPPPSNSDLTYADVSFYQVRVTLPAGMIVAASGMEVGKQVHGDQQTLTFIGGPMRDFYLAASEDFIIISDQVEGTRIKCYAKRGQEGAARRVLRSAVDALQSYNNRFGTYPYSELDLVSTPMLALGIEYPGIVGLSLALYEPGETLAGLPREVLLESVTAHEVAHQWFYNIIGNDQIEEPWLDEALAQYATGLYYLDTYGENEARSYKESWRERWEGVERADIPIGLPAGEYTQEEYGAIIYGRGPLFLDTLSETMGQENFDTFLKKYSTDYKWGLSSTNGFRRMAEETCGCNLEKLFEQWVY
jgi:hypothetical protein